MPCKRHHIPFMLRSLSARIFARHQMPPVSTQKDREPHRAGAAFHRRRTTKPEAYERDREQGYATIIICVMTLRVLPSKNISLVLTCQEDSSELDLSARLFAAPSQFLCHFAFPLFLRVLSSLLVLDRACSAVPTSFFDSCRRCRQGFVILQAVSAMGSLSSRTKSERYSKIPGSFHCPLILLLKISSVCWLAYRLILGWLQSLSLR
jgi:hypothetical protein